MLFIYMTIYKVCMVL